MTLKEDYRPRHAAHGVTDNRTSWDRSASAAPARHGRHAANGQPSELAHVENVHDYRNIVPAPEGAEDDYRKRQIAGLDALLDLSSPFAVTGPFPAVSPALTTRPRVLTLLKDPALRGALALMVSAVVAGSLGLMFWSVTAHHQNASAVGSVSAEVSSIAFLAGVGSLNLINVFARFLPEAGWYARRLILMGYGGAALTGLLGAVIFLLTPMATGLVLGGGTRSARFRCMRSAQQYFQYPRWRTGWIRSIHLGAGREYPRRLGALGTVACNRHILVGANRSPMVVGSAYGDCGPSRECTDHWRTGWAAGKAAPEPAAFRRARAFRRDRICHHCDIRCGDFIPACPGDAATRGQPGWLLLRPLDHRDDGIPTAQ